VSEKKRNYSQEVEVYCYVLERKKKATNAWMKKAQPTI
jgi:hypothetical protein